MSEFTAKHRYGLCIVLFGIAVFLFSFRLSHRDLLKSSEGRVARVAQEMIDRDDFVVPHLNGNVRYEKPPMSSWLTVVAVKATGAESIQAKHAYAQCVLSAAFLIVLVFLWGCRKPSFHMFHGLWAAVVLASTAEFYRSARTGELNLFLTLTIAAAIYCWVGQRSIRLKTPEKTGLYLFYMIGFYLALIAGCLTKGPVGLAQVVPVIIIWSLWERKNQPSQPLQWKFPAFHFAGIIVSVGLILLWLIPFIEHSGFSWGHISDEVGTHVSSEDANRKAKGFFYYLPRFFGWTLPWCIFLPFVFMRPKETSTTSKDIELLSQRRLWWIWLGWTLLFFSMISAKERHYIAAAFVPFALLISDVIAEFAHNATIPTNKRRTAVFAVLILVGVIAAAIGIVWPLKADMSHVITQGSLWMWGGGMTAAGVTASVLAWLVYKGKKEATALIFTWGILLMFGGGLYAVLKEAANNNERSVAPFCKKVVSVVPANKELFDAGVAVGKNGPRGAPLFYLNRNVTPWNEKTAKRFRNRESGLFALVNSARLKELNENGQLPSSCYDVVLHTKEFSGKWWGANLIRSRSQKPNFENHWRKPVQKKSE